MDNLDEDDLAFFSKPIKKPPLNYAKQLIASSSDSEEESELDTNKQALEHINAQKNITHNENKSAEPLSRQSTILDADEGNQDVSDTTPNACLNEGRHSPKSAISCVTQPVSPVYNTRAAANLRNNSINSEAALSTTSSLLDDDFARRLEEIDRQVQEFEKSSSDMDVQIHTHKREIEEDDDNTSADVPLLKHSKSDHSTLYHSKSEFSTNEPVISVVLQLAVIGQRIPNSNISLPRDWEAPLFFKVKSNQQFRRVRIAYSERKKVDNVVLVFQNQRLWDYGTPKGAGMLKVDTRLVVHAYCHSDFISLKRIKELEVEKLSSVTEDSTAQTCKLITLLLRSSKSEDLRLSIPVDFTVKDLIKRYCTEVKISFHERIRLEFEGEWLDPNDQVQSTELEDEDQVSVVLD
ncbi:DNA repair protein, SUMO-related Rad60 [Schizosaccharomyces pombe]|uniref:DNA repair protein rad60 n=1 Tax=Schizosaccharomyces pombe (strain 972 / ATCC 24843) TaxID=284812 RepID=RAD60_SCHPO|nr:DNA repair protein Rad60 [Schizosaccharomyces pombe]Q9USX3.1 RecName: Full=DNA repair protein rad60 [Schizosaccharomyces pombe 972h-]BAC07534.1 dna repair protein Rad60p [Schizosaccharomyces pombe]CAB58968.1 DNA repair protein Rad60 [Schizosaccharomyces pombe]|eukprot:NP_595995.1 DNA repair protein Rad60 [Schizosaccharomyces pombe]